MDKRTTGTKSDLRSGKGVYQLGFFVKQIELINIMNG